MSKDFWIGRVHFSFDVYPRSWALPCALYVGTPYTKWSGFTFELLCFDFSVELAPKAYCVPESARDSHEVGWLAQYEPKRDRAYLMEGLEFEVAEIEALTERVRNTLNLLREVQDATEGETTPQQDETPKGGE
jgi:hypothetical protein